MYVYVYIYINTNITKKQGGITSSSQFTITYNNQLTIIRDIRVSSWLNPRNHPNMQPSDSEYNLIHQSQKMVGEKNSCIMLYIERRLYQKNGLIRRRLSILGRIPPMLNRRSMPRCLGSRSVSLLSSCALRCCRMAVSTSCAEDPAFVFRGTCSAIQKSPECMV